MENKMEIKLQKIEDKVRKLEDYVNNNKESVSEKEVIEKLQEINLPKLMSSVVTLSTTPLQVMAVQ